MRRAPFNPIEQKPIVFPTFDRPTASESNARLAIQVKAEEHPCNMRAMINAATDLSRQKGIVEDAVIDVANANTARREEQ